MILAAELDDFSRWPDNIVLFVFVCLHLFVYEERERENSLPY